MKFVVLMGPPGAGKGTQAKLAEVALGLPQISSGELFRYNLSQNTELGKLAQPFLDRGELVPDSVTIAMVGDRLNAPDCVDGAILDGFPRTISQAEALDKLVDELGAAIAGALTIQVEDDVLVARLLNRAEKEGRADDNEETIRVRMQVYRDRTEPLLEYYQNKDLLLGVNGDQSIEDVQNELISVIRVALEAVNEE